MFIFFAFLHNISQGTPATVTVPGAANTLILLIEVNSAVGVDTGLSRIKLILPSPWTFRYIFYQITT